MSFTLHSHYDDRRKGKPTRFEPLTAAKNQFFDDWIGLSPSIVHLWRKSDTADRSERPSSGNQTLISRKLFATSTMAPTSTGTFEPLRHRSGTMRERLHAYTKRTLGAGGSYNDAVCKLYFSSHGLEAKSMHETRIKISLLLFIDRCFRWRFRKANLVQHGLQYMLLTFTMMWARYGPLCPLTHIWTLSGPEKVSRQASSTDGQMEPLERQCRYPHLFISKRFWAGLLTKSMTKLNSPMTTTKPKPCASSKHPNLQHCVVRFSDDCSEFMVLYIRVSLGRWRRWIWHLIWILASSISCTSVLNLVSCQREKSNHWKSWSNLYERNTTRQSKVRLQRRGDEVAAWNFEIQLDIRTSDLWRVRLIKYH